jgi:hypothetical protein
MRSSSEQPTGATAELWLRRAAGTPAVGFAAALTGNSFGTLTDAVALSLALSDEARRLLDGMELRVRTLTATVAMKNERCVYSVRGPVLWAETMTARANSFGTDDVFICSASERSFDTVENRTLVAALDAVAAATRALDGPLADRLTPEEAERARSVAGEAATWRAHPRLAGVRAGRLTGRDAARLRGGHRMSRMAAVVAVRDRAQEPFGPEVLARLSDAPTRAYHRFLYAVLEVLERRELVDGDLQLSEGTLRAGGLSFAHPALSKGGRPAGVCYRNVALLPPEELLDRLPWREQLPERGVVIGSTGELEWLLDRLAEREQERRTRRSAAQVSGSSSS